MNKRSLLLYSQRIEVVLSQLTAITQRIQHSDKVEINEGCKVLTSDAKVGISEKGPFHYPDVSVTCDDRDRLARRFIRYPCLIVEVLSPGTEAVDRGEKFRHYRRVETLREYLLIDPDQMSVECYRLNERGNWELFHFYANDTESNAGDCEVHLASVEFKFPFSLLYEDVEFAEEQSD